MLREEELEQARLQSSQMEEALGRAVLPEGLCEVFIGFLRKAAPSCEAPFGPQALSDCLTWHSPSAQGGHRAGNVTPFDR